MVLLQHYNNLVSNKLAKREDVDSENGSSAMLMQSNLMTHLASAAAVPRSAKLMLKLQMHCLQASHLPVCWRQFKKRSMYRMSATGVIASVMKTQILRLMTLTCPAMVMLQLMLTHLGCLQPVSRRVAGQSRCGSRDRARTNS